ncbi:hypothetical protein AB0I53_20450 [Saccharopolyspora sp. NPDC050389]|uniref:hypothetical protein n=1 Tax=Saccharopolyspora sp. NPDC050389 TaxID=3155516 RepID=UPI0033D7FA95
MTGRGGEASPFTAVHEMRWETCGCTMAPPSRDRGARLPDSLKLSTWDRDVLDGVLSSLVHSYSEQGMAQFLLWTANHFGDWDAFSVCGQDAFECGVACWLPERFIGRPYWTERSICECVISLRSCGRQELFMASGQIADELANSLDTAAVRGSLVFSDG